MNQIIEKEPEQEQQKMSSFQDARLIDTIYQDIEPLFDFSVYGDDKDGISDIAFNDPEYKVYYIQVNGRWTKRNFADIGLGNPNELEIIIDTFLKQVARYRNVPLNIQYPYLTTDIPKYEYRITANIPPNSYSHDFMIRVGNRREFSLEDFVDDPNTIEELKKLINEHVSILVSGGTSTGKTSFTNALLNYMNPEKRVICIENMRELRFKHHKNVSYIKAVEGISHIDASGNRVPAYMNNVNYVNRAAPDFIVFSELTIISTQYWQRCCNIDQPIITTIHASNPHGSILAVQDNLRKVNIIMDEKQILSMISHVVQLNKDPDTNIRSAKIYKTKDEYYKGGKNFKSEYFDQV